MEVELYAFQALILIGGAIGFYLIHWKLDVGEEQRRYIIKRIEHLEKEWSWLRGRLPLSPEDQAMMDNIIEGHKKEQSIDAIVSGLSQTGK
jgi:hypothetical protein